MNNLEMKILRKFFHSEKSVAIILLLCACTAISFANSSYLVFYEKILGTKISVPESLHFSLLTTEITLRNLVDDCLMTLFFLLVGLELKREILYGELSSKKHALLPLICAAAGVLVPIAIYFAFNFRFEKSMPGFAIPCATDIAFAYAIICALSKIFSHSLRVFILALAVIDDLFAVLIIALFYSKGLAFSPLAGGFLCFVILIILSKSKVTAIWPFLLTGLFLWVFLDIAKITPTIAGSLLAMAIPLEKNKRQMAKTLSNWLEKWVNYGILPIFVFLNCGINFKFGEEDLFKNLYGNPIFLGCCIGLFFGKQLGIMLAALICKGFDLASLPKQTNWGEFYCASVFTGIGFTMSIYITSLAFANGSLEEIMAKSGVLIGSLLSALFGLFLAAILLFKRRIIH